MYLFKLRCHCAYSLLRIFAIFSFQSQNTTFTKYDCAYSPMHVCANTCFVARSAMPPPHQLSMKPHQPHQTDGPNKWSSTQFPTQLLSRLFMVGPITHLICITVVLTGPLPTTISLSCWSPSLTRCRPLAPQFRLRILKLS